MKPIIVPSTGSKAGNLSIFAVVLSIFIFGCVVYNEDVKSMAEFPLFSHNSKSQNPIAPETPKNPTNNTDDNAEDQPTVTNSRTIVETEVVADDTIKSTIQETDLNIQIPKIDNDEEEDPDAVEIETPPQECDLFTGDWVFDNVTHPLYEEEACPFLTAQVTCMRNGRKDSSYQKWRWQPKDCSLPK